MSEKRELLLQEDIDATKKNLIDTHVGFVGSDWCIGWNELTIFAQFRQRGRQRIVMHAAAAVHAGGSGGEVGNSHTNLR